LTLESITEYGINKINLCKDDKLGNCIYFVALPSDSGTKIILYSTKNNIAAECMKMEFLDLQLEQKLEKISAIISIWGNNIYGNEKFEEQFKKYKMFLQFLHKNRNNETYSLTINDIFKLYNMMENNKYNLFHNG
jgi:hypothetical protein